MWLIPTWTKLFKVSGQALEQIFPSRFLHLQRVSVVGWRSFDALNQESDFALSRELDHMDSRASFPPELFSDWTQKLTDVVAGYTYPSKQHSCKEYFWEAELNHLNQNTNPWHCFGLPLLAACQPVHGHSWGHNTHSSCVAAFSRLLKVWSEMFACQWELVPEKGPRHFCSLV